MSLTYRSAVGSMAHGVIEDRDGQIVAQVWDTDGTGRKLAAALDLLEAVTYQLDLNQWIESADPEDPFFDETLRLRLNTASDYMIAAIAKATGEAAP